MAKLQWRKQKTLAMLANRRQWQREFDVTESSAAEIEIEQNTFTLTKNQSTFIPLKAKHRLINPGPQPLTIIEIQSGTYIGEDDIIRFKDDYGRTEKIKE